MNRRRIIRALPVLPLLAKAVSAVQSKAPDLNRYLYDPDTGQWSERIAHLSQHSYRLLSQAPH